MRPRHGAPGAILAVAMGLSLQAGCDGVLGLSPGTASDGEIGSPCDLTSDRQTPCVDTAVCALQVCRNACTADSDCAADERCIVADGYNDNGNNGNSNGGGEDGGSGSLGGGSGGPFNGSSGGSTPTPLYGCVPLSASACNDGCPGNDVCDASNQCRTPCSPGPGSSPGSGGCAADQFCQPTGNGTYGCYGPHDMGAGAPDATADDDGGGTSEDSSGGSDSTTGEGTCAGTPAYATCAQCAPIGCSCAGCNAVQSTGTCSGTPLSCAECGSLYGCSLAYCAGCTSTPTGQCSGSLLYPSCASCPLADCGNQSFCPGCVISSTGTCTGTLTPCSANTTQSTCQGERNCVWTGTTSCTGTPEPCSTLTSAGECSGQMGCGWAAGQTTTCAGTPTACESLTAATCSSQPGCSSVSDDGPVNEMEDAGACDAAAYDDASPLCNCLAPSGAQVAIIASTAIPAAPQGGVIQPGTYVLTRVIFYSSQEPSGASLGSARSTIVISGSSWQEVDEFDSTPADTSSSTFVTSGSQVDVTSSCPGGPAQAWSFSATSDAFDLFVGESADAGGAVGTFVETYALSGP